MILSIVHQKWTYGRYSVQSGDLYKENKMNEHDYSTTRKKNVNPGSLTGRQTEVYFIIQAWRVSVFCRELTCLTASSNLSRWCCLFVSLCWVPGDQRTTAPYKLIILLRYHFTFLVANSIRISHQITSFQNHLLTGKKIVYTRSCVSCNFWNLSLSLRSLPLTLRSLYDQCANCSQCSAIKTTKLTKRPRELHAVHVNPLSGHIMKTHSLQRANWKTIARNNMYVS